MPTNDEFQVYREALAAELQPAMGCTEPIALAYAAAKVGKRLGGTRKLSMWRSPATSLKTSKASLCPIPEGSRALKRRSQRGSFAAVLKQDFRCWRT